MSFTLPFNVLKICITCCTLIISVSLAGQEFGKLPKEISIRVIQARQVSEALLPQYSWTSRTEVLKGNEILNILIERNRIAPDGTIISTLLNHQGAKMPTAFLIKQIAEDQKASIEKFLYGLRDFLKRYTLHDTIYLDRFLQTATFQTLDTARGYIFTGNHVIQQGDKLKWWIDGDLYSTQKTEVTAVFEGDTVHFTGTFITLRSGLNYMGYAQVTIPSRNLTLQIQNYDYTPE